MIERLNEFLVQEALRALPARVRPKPSFRFLLVKGSLGAYAGKVSVFIFADGQPIPARIAKITRNPGCSRLLKAEYDALSYIHKSVSTSLACHVPQVFTLQPLGEYEVLLEEAVTGDSIDKIILAHARRSKKTAYGFLERSCEWLIQLTREVFSKENNCFDESYRNELIGKPIELFSSRYDGREEETRFLAQLQEDVRRLASQHCPLVITHGDFSPINIIFAKEKFWVIDWSSYRPKGFPLQDLIFLLLWSNFCRYAPEAAGTARVDTFLKFFFREGEHAVFCERLIRKYCEALGIDLSLVETLFALFLIERANNEYDIYARQGELGYIPLMKPFDRGHRFIDGTLLKNGVYIKLFRSFIENRRKFIFSAG